MKNLADQIPGDSAAAPVTHYDVSIVGLMGLDTKFSERGRIVSFH